MESNAHGLGHTRGSRISSPYSGGHKIYLIIILSLGSANFCKFMESSSMKSSWSLRYNSNFMASMTTWEMKMELEERRKFTRFHERQTCSNREPLPREKEESQAFWLTAVYLSSIFLGLHTEQAEWRHAPLKKPDLPASLKHKQVGGT